MIEVQSMSCREALEAISLRLDDELKADDVLRLEAHLESCSDCRKEDRLLLAGAEERRSIFESCVESAPPLPLDLSRSHAHPGRWPVAAGIALLVLAGAALILVESLNARRAGAAEILQSAAANWLGHDDAQLEADVEVFLVGSSDPLDRVELEVFIAQAGKLLVREANTPVDPPPVSGFDGTESWTYDPQRAVLRISETDQQAVRLQRPGFSLEIGGNIQKTVHYLTIDLVRELKELATDPETDVTVERGSDGNVTYSITLDGGDERWLSEATTAVVIIDPRQRRILQMRAETLVGGVLVMSAHLRTVRTDVGLPDAFFRPAAHVPPGIAVEPIDPGDR